MYKLTATLQSPQVIDRILSAAAVTVAVINRADVWFQSHIVLWVHARSITNQSKTTLFNPNQEFINYVSDDCLSQNLHPVFRILPD